ncbi:MAG TPA: hypothetical protein VF606_02470, partial [Geminicoccaceae bacterium]
MRGTMAPAAAWAGAAIGVALAAMAAALPAGTARAADAAALEEQALACAGCHGEAGVPTEPNIPVIWGQHEGYLYLQLRDYKLG